MEELCICGTFEALLSDGTKTLSHAHCEEEVAYVSALSPFLCLRIPLSLSISFSLSLTHYFSIVLAHTHTHTLSLCLSPASTHSSPLSLTSPIPYPSSSLLSVLIYLLSLLRARMPLALAA